MSLQVILKNSSQSGKEPTSGQLANGEIALNYHADGPFLTCKDTNGTVRRVTGVWVSASAPTSPTPGELWLDIALSPPQFKIYKDGTDTWVPAIRVYAATTTQAGVVELSTDEETQAGTSINTAVTPASLQSKISDSTSTTSSTTIASSTAVKNTKDVADAALPKAGGTMTGQILGDDSTSASTPAYAFDGDADTGLLRTGPNALALVTSGTSRLTINSSGVVVIPGDLTVQGTTTTIDTQNLSVKDKNIEIGVTTSPSDVTADGGGITLKGASDKTIVWLDATDSWTFSEHLSLASGKSYRINNVEVLSATALGAGVSVANANTTATSSNTANAIVARDTSGNFSAGNITATLSGNASTATALSSARNFTLSGDVTGTVSSDLTSGASISTSIASGVIVDADINASAAIALSKLATGALPSGITIASTNITDGTIVNADVNASAAIDGTKISPNFGSQNTTTSGTSTAASFIPTSSGIPTNGLYLSAANNISIATNSTQRLLIDSNGQIEAAGLGSAASPAWSYIGDPNTGSFSPGADTWSVSTGGSERVRVTASGFVGIGTTSVLNRFQLFQSAPAAVPAAGIGGHCFAAGDTSFGLTAGALNSGNGYIQVTRWDGTAINYDLLLQPNGGRVGVNTSSPTSTFSVSGNIGSLGRGTSTGFTFADWRIYNTSSGNALAIDNYTTEALRIDSSLRFLVGTSAAPVITGGNIFGGAQFGQVTINSSSNVCAQVCAADRADGFGPHITFVKSRSSTIGGTTIVQTGDTLGGLGFNGLDGSNPISAAAILCQVDGTPGLNDMPGRIVLMTTSDGASVPTERLRVDSAGRLGIGINAPTSFIHARGLSTDFVGRFEPINNLYSSTLYLSSTGSGDGGIRYESASNWFRLISYGDTIFNVGTANINGTIGDERARITQGGRFGLNQSVPVTLMHLNNPTTGLPATSGTAQANGALRIAATGTTGVLDIGPNSNIPWIQATDATDLSQTYAILLNPNGGNVGIGITTLPTARLQVTGATAAGYFIFRGGSTAGGYGSFLNSTGTAVGYIGNGAGAAISGGASTDFVIRSEGNLIFAEGNSEAARFDTSSRFLVGTSTASSQVAGNGVHIKSNAVGTGFTNTALVLEGTGGDFYAMSFVGTNLGLVAITSGAVDYLSFGNSGGDRFVIYADGKIGVPNVYSYVVGATNRDLFIDSSGFIGYVSSTRQSKANITSIEDISWLYSLNPVTFNRKEKSQHPPYEFTGEISERTEYGLIAEEVEPIAPEICFYDQINGKDELSGVQYSQLIIPMLKALQQANERIEQLEAKVTVLMAN